MKKIPLEELSFSFSRSSGPGGQNVNKVNTKVTMTWSLKSSSLYSQAHKERFIKQYGRYIFDDNVIIKSQRYRSQQKNIEDCRHKLHELLLSVKKPPPVRKATKPNRKQVQKRLDDKKKHSQKKQERRVKY